ncbi:MAG: secretin N-terminal domain-containing protein [Pseudanabaenaceae cyanobacterium bins.39]|nr:secretin N-terminal domain-containing protein [Pseudanabaenaceae cyanobacterium bins.39]
MNSNLSMKLRDRLPSKSLACWFLIATSCPQVLMLAPSYGQNTSISANPAPEVVSVASRITDIATNVADDRLNLVVNFASSDRPQVTYTRQGKTWVALLNGAQLQLSNGNASYTKTNPAPGVTAIEATQYAANRVRIRVTATDPEMFKELIKRQDNGDSLIFSLEMNQMATNTPSNTISAANIPTQGMINASNQPSEGDRILVAQNTTANNASVAQPLFKPEVTITAPNGNTRTAQTNAPSAPVTPVATPVTPQLPGRVPGVVPPIRPIRTPPVGDIATTTAKLRADIVDLGTAERVPRITLRNAPAIEVLTLIGRVAGLSVVSADSGSSTDTGSAPGAAPAATGATGATAVSKPVSLDIENEPAQDVFNNVLRITGLEANRIGNTIFVATRLPVTLKNLITKSYRLNQISAGEASAYLIGLGAARVVNRQRPIPGVQTATIGSAATTVVNVTTESVPTLETVSIPNDSGATPLLKGLQVIAEERSNSVTLIGSPRQIEFAEAQLARLDTRKRQVSVNVRIVDVQLLRNQSFSSQMSFGLNDTFYTVRDGVAVANFGQFNPATSPRNSLTSQPIINNPYSGATPFIDLSRTQVFPNSTVVTRTITPSGIVDTIGDIRVFGTPSLVPSSNPFSTGVTAVTQGTPTIIDRTVTPNTIVQGTPGTITNSLASLFQYPMQFLLSLQAQVVSGNAKVLTDPTLTVQEGETATVALTQEVLGSTKRSESAGTSPGSVTVTTTQEIVKAGLSLNIQIDRIDDNGFVNLSLSPKVSAPVNQVTLPDGSIVTLLSERTLNSGKIRLRDGQTFILSGVIQDTDRETVTKVPILGDLPIIGALFRGSNSQNTRSEVIIVVTPRIMDDSQNATWGYTYQPGPETQRVLDSNQIKPQ